MARNVPCGKRGYYMEKYTITEILTSLRNRLKWYEKACLIKEKTIPYENGFDFPDGNIDNWYGAVKELNNTISMLEHGIK